MTRLYKDVFKRTQLVLCACIITTRSYCSCSYSTHIRSHMGIYKERKLWIEIGCPEHSVTIQEGLYKH